MSEDTFELLSKILRILDKNVVNANVTLELIDRYSPVLTSEQKQALLAQARLARDLEEPGVIKSQEQDFGDSGYF